LKNKKVDGFWDTAYISYCSEP